MKLTLAMGLQYDNGKSNQLYALTLGQGSEKVPVQSRAVAGSSVPASLPVITPIRKDASLTLTYSSEGFPVQFMLGLATINVFA